MAVGFDPPFFGIRPTSSRRLVMSGCEPSHYLRTDVTYVHRRSTDEPFRMRREGRGGRGEGVARLLAQLNMAYIIVELN